MQTITFVKDRSLMNPLLPIKRSAAVLEMKERKSAVSLLNANIFCAKRIYFTLIHGESALFHDRRWKGNLIQIRYIQLTVRKTQWIDTDHSTFKQAIATASKWNNAINSMHFQRSTKTKKSLEIYKNVENLSKMLENVNILPRLVLKFSKLTTC